jgi:hypothetical protein
MTSMNGSTNSGGTNINGNNVGSNPFNQTLNTFDDVEFKAVVVNNPPITNSQLANKSYVDSATGGGAAIIFNGITPVITGSLGFYDTTNGKSLNVSSIVETPTTINLGGKSLNNIATLYSDNIKSYTEDLTLTSSTKITLNAISSDVNIYSDNFKYNNNKVATLNDIPPSAIQTLQSTYDNSNPATMKTLPINPFIIQGATGKVLFQTSVAGESIIMSDMTATSIATTSILGNNGGTIIIASPTDLGSNKITSSYTPTNPTDLTNKAYVDTSIANIPINPLAISHDNTFTKPSVFLMSKDSSGSIATNSGIQLDGTNLNLNNYNIEVCNDLMCVSLSGPNSTPIKCLVDLTQSGQPLTDISLVNKTYVDTQTTTSITTALIPLNAKTQNQSAIPNATDFQGKMNFREPTTLTYGQSIQFDYGTLINYISSYKSSPSTPCNLNITALNTSFSCPITATSIGLQSGTNQILLGNSTTIPQYTLTNASITTNNTSLVSSASSTQVFQTKGLITGQNMSLINTSTDITISNLTPNQEMNNIFCANTTTPFSARTYYYQMYSNYAGTISSLSYYLAVSGSDIIRVAIYRGTLSYSTAPNADLCGQSNFTSMNKIKGRYTIPFSNLITNKNLGFYKGEPFIVGFSVSGITSSFLATTGSTVVDYSYYNSTNIAETTFPPIPQVYTSSVIQKHLLTINYV